MSIKLFQHLFYLFCVFLWFSETLFLFWCVFLCLGEFLVIIWEHFEIFCKLISFGAFKVILTFTLILPMQNQHSRQHFNRMIIIIIIFTESLSDSYFIILIISVCFMQKVANVFHRYRSLGGNLNCNQVTDWKADWLEIFNIVTRNCKYC